MAWAPPPDDEQFQQIKASIATEGLQDPEGWRFDGYTLDANTRGRACAELGILEQMHWSEFDPAVHGDPEGFVIRKNVHRRHLSSKQLADVMARLRDRGATNEEIATTLGTSERTVRRRLSEAAQDSQSAGADSEPAGNGQKTAPRRRRKRGSAVVSETVTNTRGQQRPRTYQQWRKMVDANQQESAGGHPDTAPARADSVHTVPELVRFIDDFVENMADYAATQATTQDEVSAVGEAVQRVFTALGGIRSQVAQDFAQAHSFGGEIGRQPRTQSARETKKSEGRPSSDATMPVGTRTAQDLLQQTKMAGRPSGGRVRPPEPKKASEPGEDAGEGTRPPSARRLRLLGGGKPA
jgi:hypothetical protein